MPVEEVSRVVGLQIAKASRLPMLARDTVVVEAGAGIVGDRYHGSRHRHVTVQSLEEIALAEAEYGHALDPIATRRNVTLESGLLDRTPGARLVVGAVRLEVVRDAAPCKLLEDELGRGAKLALHRRAGVVFRALSDGAISLGDAVRFGP